MPRGNHNNHNNHRGRGRGRPYRAGPAGTHHGPRHPYPHANTEIDVVVQQWVEPAWAEPISDVVVGGHGHGPGSLDRGYGPWRGGTPKSRSGAGTPSRGMDSPRRGNGTQRGRGRGGRGRGRGRGWAPDNDLDSTPSRRPRHGVGSAVKAKTTIGKDAPLTELLHSTRPLLRPIKFVRATLTPFLFQHSEEVLKPAVDINASATEVSPVPTADRVARLFHENASDSDSESDRVEDALEEIDFADLARMRAEVDAIAQETMETPRGAHDVIEEVDFADLGAYRAQVDAAEPHLSPHDDVLEEVFTGIYNRVKHESGTVDDTLEESSALNPSIDISNQSNRESIPKTQDTTVFEETTCLITHGFLNAPANERSLSSPTETHPVPTNLPSPPGTPEPPLFVIDTTPTLPLPRRSSSEVILVDRAGHGETLGEDEERIVYVAPHPRSGRASPMRNSAPSVQLSRMSVLTGAEPRRLTSPIREDEDAAGMNIEKEPGFVSLGLSPSVPVQDAKAVRRARKKEARKQRKQQRQSKRGFGAFGAIMSEAQLREGDAAEKRRPEWATRRRGDSDLDWGTEGEDEGNVRDDGVDALSNDLEGMVIDVDLDVDVMRGFLKSLSPKGSQFVTMDDIEDEAQLRREDEDGSSEGSSDSEPNDEVELEDDDEEAVFNLEEKVLIAESNDERSSDSDDDETSPRSSFQARLRKVRERGLRSKTAVESSDDEDDEGRTRGADDEEFLAYIQDVLEENSEILSSRDRKQRNALFRNLHEGYVDDAEFTTPVQKKKDKKGKGKGKDFGGAFSSELQAQWAKDRAKKAARRQERETARLAAALDPLSTPKGASRKAARAAAKLEPRKAQSITPLAVVDPASLEALIRRFAKDGRRSVALPAMDKEARKTAHALAAAFGIKSVSKGKGTARYTTLFKTARTGMGVKEGRVKAAVRQYTGGGGRRSKPGVPRHKEGDEVGKEAPKIGEGNIGFRMLASMGWSEGDRIGGSDSVGLETPLTAVIKHSKLGLGATR